MVVVVVMVMVMMVMVTMMMMMMMMMMACAVVQTTELSNVRVCISRFEAYRYLKAFWPSGKRVGYRIAGCGFESRERDWRGKGGTARCGAVRCGAVGWCRAGTARARRGCDFLWCGCARLRSERRRSALCAPASRWSALC